MTEVGVRIVPKLIPMFSVERGAVRYRCAYGGRGSGKSLTFAIMAAVFGYRERLRILCTREYQNSIEESFFAELSRAISMYPFLSAHYKVGRHYITGKNGTEFIFKGLRSNTSSIKSTTDIGICIVEEAEYVSESAWIDLEPTVRQKKSEIWVIWNPKKEGSPVDMRFRQNVPPKAIITELNYTDNPYFTSVMDDLRLQNKNTFDSGLYNHIWNGDYLRNSDSQVFNNKYIVEEFEAGEDWTTQYGLDFGFSQDPTAAVKVRIHDNILYVEAEAVKVGLELDHTINYIEQAIPDIRSRIIYADCSRPESISYLKRHGWGKIVGEAKLKVEDGIAHMRSYKRIVIHPRCTHTIREFELYSFKVDRISGEVLDAIVDANNHCIDAIRYALFPLIKRKKVEIWGKL